LRLDLALSVGWGTKVIDRLSTDLRREFPEMSGFSSRNLKYMRALATAYPAGPIVQQLVALLPWGHNVRILDATKDPVEREFYLRQTVQHGWSRNVLVHHEDDQPSIGIVLCKTKKRLVVEYALRDLSNAASPLGSHDSLRAGGSASADLRRALKARAPCGRLNDQLPEERP
jgi:hypothetical protein